MNETPASVIARNSNSRAWVECDILTVEDVAQFLRVPKSTVYKLARSGQLPASKVGKHWRFLRADVHEWVHVRVRR